MMITIVFLLKTTRKARAPGVTGFFAADLTPAI